MASTSRRRRAQLHKSKILVQKTGGFFTGKKIYKLVVEEEDNRDVPVLQAAPERNSFWWWRKSTHCIYGQANSENEEARRTSPVSGFGDEWEYVGRITSPGWFYDRSVIYNEHGNSKAVAMYSCTSRTGDLMRMQVALPRVHIEKIPALSKMISTSSQLPRDCAFVIACFVGNLYWSEDFTDINPSNCHRLFDLDTEADDADNDEDDEEKTNASMNTPLLQPSRSPNTDTPLLEEEEKEEQEISPPAGANDSTTQCEHCGTPQCSCNARPSSNGSGSSEETPSNEKAGKLSLIYHNKLPVWNPGINAYTLEFCGRARLPSVHNFQLVNDRGDVVLQLGKVENGEFNMDFGHPLSAFQAFSICLSVIQRTFVWD